MYAMLIYMKTIDKNRSFLMHPLAKTLHLEKMMQTKKISFLLLRRPMHMISFASSRMAMTTMLAPAARR